VRELLCGSTRFNDIRRGVPRMSASLLAQRLRRLEEIGVVKLRISDQRDRPFRHRDRRIRERDRPFR
jgi:DNA-binding HxlR family transcriptional regulator